MSSKLLSVLEENFVTLIKVHLSRDNLEIARLVTAPGGNGLDVIHMELYTKQLLKRGDLSIDRSNRWVTGMLEKLSTSERSCASRDRIEIFCGSKPAQAVIHFEDIEDVLHWMFSHGGYITHIRGSLQDPPA